MFCLHKHQQYPHFTPQQNYSASSHSIIYNAYIYSTKRVTSNFIDCIVRFFSYRQRYISHECFRIDEDNVNTLQIATMQLHVIVNARVGMVELNGWRFCVDLPKNKFSCQNE